MSEFADKLGVLVAMELSKIDGDPERAGEVIERLLNAAGLVIATAARGNSEGMSEMLMGAETYLHEAAAGHSRLAQFLATAKAHRLPPDLPKG